MASLQQRAITLVHRVRGSKQFAQDPDRLIQDAHEKQRDYPTPPPEKIRRRVDVAIDESIGFPVYTFRPKPGARSSQRHAVYIHGGSYLYDIAPAHFRLIATLVERAGLTILAPIYPLAPAYTWRDSLPQICELARAQTGPGAPLVMGDSAGGGYALAVAEVMASEGRKPAAVLISPYGDALFSDPRTAEYDARDPCLTAVALRAVLLAWVGDDDPQRPEISPLSGSFTGIDRLLVITGTNDVLHPQALQIYDKARAERVYCRLVIADGGLHTYPLLRIPEARRAIDAIIDFITHSETTRTATALNA
jgi:acetyl esterase/lipase